MFSLTAPVLSMQRAPAGAMAFSASSMLTSTASRMISGSLGGSTSSGGSSATREHTARENHRLHRTRLGRVRSAKRARLRTSLSHGRRGLRRRREFVTDVAREWQTVRQLGGKRNVRVRRGGQLSPRDAVRAAKAPQHRSAPLGASSLNACGSHAPGAAG